MGFEEEKKENESMNGANCVHNNFNKGDLIKPDHEKGRSFDMEESEEHDERQEGRQLQERHAQGDSQVVDLTGDGSAQLQRPQLTHNYQAPTNGLADQAAQQLLAQASINQQQQQLQQMAQQPGIALDATAFSILPQQTFGYPAQSANHLIPGSLNLVAVQNALIQNHNQAVAHAQASALINGGGVVAPPSNGLADATCQLGNVLSGFSLGQQVQTQQQSVQPQQTQQVSSSGSSMSSTNGGFPSVFPNTQPATNVLSPTSQIGQTTSVMSQPLLSAVPYTTPSIFGPALPASSLTLTPQQTIPHYIPPTPASWGAPLPTLTIQDRPLVPPIYNGINPNYPKAQMLHAHPPIFCVHDFLSPAECDFLIEAASDAFGPAPVVGKGQGEVSPSRTSSTCYLAREDLPEYLRKVSLLTGKPAEHCELPQVGRYLPSQQYLQHFDAFDLSNEDGRRFAQNGGQRTITVLTYLNDVGLGGATAFPNLNLQVQPRRGMAIVFFPSTLDGLLDKMALHAALPAVDIKYVSQVWIRQTNYDGRPSKRLAKPMLAGMQEQRDKEELEKSVQAQMLMGQFGLQQLSAGQQQGN